MICKLFIQFRLPILTLLLLLLSDFTTISWLYFVCVCVCRYYKDIQALPSISDQDMAAMLAEHSHNHQYDFHTMTALNELYFYYACTYKVEVSISN